MAQLGIEQADHMAPCGKGTRLLLLLEFASNSSNSVRGYVLAKLSKNTDLFSGWFMFRIHTPILSGIGGQSLLFF